MGRDELRQLLELLPDAHVLLDNSLRITLSSEQADTLLGLKPIASEHLEPASWLPPDSEKALRAWLRHPTEPLHFISCSALSDIPRWLAATATRIELDGEPAHLIALRPVKGPHLEEDTDLAHYRRLREIAVVRGIGVYEYDHLTGSVYRSGEAEAQYGVAACAPASIEAFTREVHPDDVEYFEQEMRKAQDPEGDGVFDIRHRVLNSDGQTRWLHTCARTHFHEDKTGALRKSLTSGSVVDITQATLSEQSNRRLASILDVTPDLVAIADFSGRLTYLNPAGRRLTGLTSERDIAQAMAIDVLDQRIRERFVEEALPTAIDQQHWVGELRLRAVDKSEGVPVTAVVLAHKQTRSLGAYLSLIAHDLTQQKSLEAQLLHSQKLEAVGRLAGGVAHDFNNLLSVILGFTSIALDDTTLTERARAGLEEVIRASERAAKLTAQLLSFSRKQVLMPKVVDVATILSDMRPMLTRLVGEQIELTLSQSHTPARIEADPNQLEQVLMNLVLNARDAIKEVGHVTVDVRSEEVTEPNHNPELNISTGRYVVIEVTDTGEGMDEETQEHIFEPFFTTKPKGSGTGLGLSTVFGIVKQSGGHIRVASEVGRGTTFRLTFPACEREVSAHRTSSWLPLEPARGRILVVEDEPQLRAVIVTVLEKCGYETLAPSGPLEALAIARQQSESLSLLLTDVVMPQMTGVQLVEALERDGHRLPVLYMSGYTEKSVVDEQAFREGVNFLPKPLTPESLLQAVQRALANTPARVPPKI